MHDYYRAQMLRLTNGINIEDYEVEIRALKKQVAELEAEVEKLRREKVIQHVTPHTYVVS